MNAHVLIRTIEDRLAYCEAHCDNDEELALVAWVAEHLSDAIGKEIGVMDDQWFGWWRAFEERALPIQAKRSRAADVANRLGGLGEKR